MASPPKPVKSTSRWGFLSQAVASVESRLDTILADEEDVPKKPLPKPATTIKDGATASRTSSDLSRSNSSSLNNDRLQARLAQAMAKKDSSRTASPAPPSQTTPKLEPSEPEFVAVLNVKDAPEIGAEEMRIEEPHQEQMLTKENDTAAAKVEATNLPLTSSNIDLSTHSATTSQKVSSSPNIVSGTPDVASFRSSTDVQSAQDAAALKLQLEHEDVVARMQEEMNLYLEKIDALQQNLSLLSRESLKEAKDVQSGPETTSDDRKLAEKDEKIALLIEEGTKLTKSELQLRNLIKKLRAQSATLTKDQDTIRARAEKAEKSLQQQEEKAQKAEAARKKADEQVASLTKSSLDAQTIAKERNALKSTLADVRSQLTQASKRAEEAEDKATSEQLETLLKENSALHANLSSAKSERELAENQLNREIADLKQSLQREKEQTRVMETEMLAEQAALESKLETFRVRAEEATSGDHGDLQAKLLRQIETLQGQYSAASSNWQGIESTLLGRITTLEKERDEVVGHETDLRRRLREATSKAKSATRELEELQRSLTATQDRSADDRAEVNRLTSKNEQLEEDIQNLKKDIEDYAKRAEKELLKRVEEERSRIIAQFQSPKKPSTPVDSLANPLERPISRRSSAQPPLSLDSITHTYSHTPPRVHSATSTHRLNGSLAQPIPETPSINLDHDPADFFTVPPTPGSLTRADSGGHPHIHDVISASTMGAGPSVQLVERLSANIRKLESEKAASKDELARLSAQRDEARNEVVTLMRDVEAKDSFENKVKEMETEMSGLKSKYGATLELLGEKTEKIEELTLDLAEVKQMYRHLCDTMGKNT